uniref:Uncharacterized protein LOC123617415 n=1 Tax=Camelus bactrianus TaxID=9837 RepID=A0A9W3HJF5_CAMBA|nr:uncharacterized protein LOC123617415 [Camelus bactrianus]
MEFGWSNQNTLQFAFSPLTAPHHTPQLRSSLLGHLRPDPSLFPLGAPSPAPRGRSPARRGRWERRGRGVVPVSFLRTSAPPVGTRRAPVPESPGELRAALGGSLRGLAPGGGGGSRPRRSSRESIPPFALYLEVPADARFFFSETPSSRVPTAVPFSPCVARDQNWRRSWLRGERNTVPGKPAPSLPRLESPELRRMLPRSNRSRTRD